MSRLMCPHRSGGHKGRCRMLYIYLSRVIPSGIGGRKSRSNIMRYRMYRQSLYMWRYIAFSLNFLTIMLQALAR